MLKCSARLNNISVYIVNYTSCYIYQPCYSRVFLPKS